MKIRANYANSPSWKELTVKSSLPAELECLDEVAHNGIMRPVTSGVLLTESSLRNVARTLFFFLRSCLMSVRKQQLMTRRS